jgi:hypothetical protein
MSKLRNRLIRHYKSKTARQQKGYVMVVTTIVLPLLISLVALATDVTIYYFRSVQLQRAADSSALAGVTRMPRFQDARREALKVAKLNGYENNATDNIVVETWFPPDNNKRFSVRIRDNFVPIFFGRLIKDNWQIEKRSTAEYISNIPLGSVENAIGTGYLTGGSPTDGMTPSFAKQNFWLAVSGPCAAKEAGDSLSSKWDGNTVNPTAPDAAAGGVATKNAYICDYQPGVTQTVAEKRAYLRNQVDDRDPATANTSSNPNRSPLFPGLSANRDYTATGYNYIVDIPCAPLTPGATPPPPPCETGLPAGQDLVIQIYDPVFNPDSVQRYINAWDLRPEARPDQFGLHQGATVADSALCRADNVPFGCQAPNVSFGAKNPSPDQIRVSTEVRIYPPDDSPLDYQGDVAMPLTDPALIPSVVAAAEAPYVTAEEAGAVVRFGSCVRWTDAWAQFNGTAVSAVGRATADSYNSPAVPVAPNVAQDVTWVNATEAAANSCTTFSDKWVTLVRIPASGTATPRGRYRINIRTIDAPYSFGTNSFALRSFFVPTASPIAYSQCSTLTSSDPLNSPCASVSGDSSMSVFASVPAVSRFYLAKLTPPALYRGKKVVVQLWDPGEGGDKLQVLRPRRRTAAGVGETVDCSPDDDVADSNYCIQRFEWSLWNPGLNALDATDPLDVDSAVAMAEGCVNKGEPQAITPAPPLPDVLSISGSPNGIPGCSAAVPADIVNSRAGHQTAGTGKFNDRLVAVTVQIPKDYGCELGTGIRDALGNDVPCTELDPTDMPQQGWWKIKYVPQVDTVNGGYKTITDRTTWAVSLRGDPVHLVTDDTSPPPSPLP